MRRSPNDLPERGVELGFSRMSEVAMAQLYRGELSRAERWRTRLDTTTNWALTTTAAVVSFGFASPQTSHVTLLVGLWMVTSFLVIEARRYRYYDHWYRRVRLVEEGFWAPLLRREPHDPDSLRELTAELARPQLRLSMLAALATRINRAYGPIILVLVISWMAKIYSHPEPITSNAQLLERAAVGPVEGGVILGVVALYLTVAIALFVLSFVARSPLGELRTRPRSHRRALWEFFARPYELKSPRRHGRPPRGGPGALPDAR